jgi:hypothetical protein
MAESAAAGYRSTPPGAIRLLEVKTTNGSARTPFFLTRNERGVAEERSADWCIYRVHLFAKEPRIFKMRAAAAERGASQAGDVARVPFPSRRRTDPCTVREGSKSKRCPHDPVG